MRRTLLWAAAAAVVVLVLAGVVVSWPALRGVWQNTESTTSFPDTSGSGPGSLISATKLPSVTTPSGARRMERARVTYRSTSGDDGREAVVTGSVYIPQGPPPDGGWPVVAFGHPSTGINEDCAPSLSDSLRGMAGFVSGLVDRGYAVALADYEGLGTPDVHRYADNRTAGYNVIDSVRALRHTFANVSDRWAGFGASQGGGAVWSADERAEVYAPELDLVGAVAIVPAADHTGLVDKAVAGTLTTDQHRSLAAIVESLARQHTDFNRDDYRRGAAAAYWDVLTSCAGDAEDRRAEAEGALQPGDLAPATPEAAERLRAYLRAWALPQEPLSAPLFVTYVGQDESIDMQWTADAIARACTTGGSVQWQIQDDRDHNNVDIDGGLTWMADRFAGKPVGDDCPG